VNQLSALSRQLSAKQSTAEYAESAEKTSFLSSAISAVSAVEDFALRLKVKS
jgi:hypothetical protein